MYAYVYSIYIRVIQLYIGEMNESKSINDGRKELGFFLL